MDKEQVAQRDVTMIDGFSQPLALILFPSTKMPGGTLISTGRDEPVGECRAALFLLTTGSPLALMVGLLAQLPKYCHTKLGGCTLLHPCRINYWLGAQFHTQLVER